MSRILFVLLVLCLLGGCTSVEFRFRYPASTATTIRVLPGASGYREAGIASFYADKYQGRLTANGERFNQFAMTAAHKTLPFGTVVRVINVRNGRSVIVRINDRGPFIKGRIIDLSRSSFSRIADPREGIVETVIEVVDRSDMISRPS